MARKAQMLRTQRVPKFAVRQRNRCSLCGRPRGYYRRFRVCRICLRTLALRGDLPGVTKSSW